MEICGIYMNRGIMKIEEKEVFE